MYFLMIPHLNRLFDQAKQTLITEFLIYVLLMSVLQNFQAWIAGTGHKMKVWFWLRELGYWNRGGRAWLNSGSLENACRGWHPLGTENSRRLWLRKKLACPSGGGLWAWLRGCGWAVIPATGAINLHWAPIISSAPSRFWEHTDGQDKFIHPLVVHSLEKETNKWEHTILLLCLTYFTQNDNL